MALKNLGWPSKQSRYTRTLAFTQGSLVQTIEHPRVTRVCSKIHQRRRMNYAEAERQRPAAEGCLAGRAAKGGRLRVKNVCGPVIAGGPADITKQTCNFQALKLSIRRNLSLPECRQK